MSLRSVSSTAFSRTACAPWLAADREASMEVRGDWAGVEAAEEDEVAVVFLEDLKRAMMMIACFLGVIVVIGSGDW